MNGARTATRESSPARITLARFQHEIQLRAPQLASGIEPHIDRPQLRLAHNDRIWLLAPLKQDPQLGADGRPVLPDSAVADLGRIAATGLEFHGIAIGHEIEMTSSTCALVPQLRAGPRSCSPELARALVGPVPAHPEAVRLVRRMVAVADVFTRSSARLPRTLARALDPVVFGLIGADERLEVGRPVLWVACTRWDW